MLLPFSPAPFCAPPGLCALVQGNASVHVCQPGLVTGDIMRWWCNPDGRESLPQRPPSLVYACPPASTLLSDHSVGHPLSGQGDHAVSRPQCVGTPPGRTHLKLPRVGGSVILTCSLPTHAPDAAAACSPLSWLGKQVRTPAADGWDSDTKIRGWPKQQCLPEGAESLANITTGESILFVVFTT